MSLLGGKVVSALLSLLLALRLMGIPATVSTFSVSAYSNINGVPPYQGLMASGYYTRPDYCACGPSFRFGTMFYISGYGAVICADRGPAITDGHLDLWMESEETAWAFGRHNLATIVIRGGER